MGPKLDFSASVPHSFFIYLLIAPKLHQKVYIDTSLDQDKKNQVKVKIRGQMGPKLDFSDGVPHNFFIYQPVESKFQQKISIDTSLAQDRENSRSRSKDRSNGPLILAKVA